MKKSLKRLYFISALSFFCSCTALGKIELSTDTPLMDQIDTEDRFKTLSKGSKVTAVCKEYGKDDQFYKIKLEDGTIGYIRVLPQYVYIDRNGNRGVDTGFPDEENPFRCFLTFF